MDAVNAERREMAESLDRRLAAMRKASGKEASPAAIPKGVGTALPEATRARMESQVGGDLTQVRVHDAADSAKAADQLGARAFTIGNDIHFGASEFAPGTKEGDRLLAHELTHAVQAQKSTVQRKAQPEVEQEHDNEAQMDVSHPGDPAEKEADAVGDKAAAQLHGDAEQKHQGDDNRQKAEVKETAPTVGRKIYLEKKKDGGDSKQNVADAAVKRMGKSGQNTEQVKEALKQIQHERAAAVSDLTALQKDLPSFGLKPARAQQGKNAIRSALNAIDAHLTDADITGAMRDVVGDPVRAPGSGKTFDHLNEVNEALNSLKTVRQTILQIRRELVTRQSDPSILAEKLDPALDSLGRVMQAVGQALKKMKP